MTTTLLHCYHPIASRRQDKTEMVKDCLDKHCVLQEDPVLEVFELYREEIASGLTTLSLYASVKASSLVVIGTSTSAAMRP